MALQEDLTKQGNFLFRHRSFLPLILLVVGLAVKVYQERFNKLASETLIAEVLEGAALAVGLAGILIRVLTIGFAADNTSGRNTGAGQVADSLNTTGAYSLTRNPLYLGNYCMWAAIAMITGSMAFVLLFTLAFWIYYERIIFAEEAFLRDKFGERYLTWASQTPAFVPRLSGFKMPEMSFRWRKVLRQEKNGLLALLLLLCVFALVGDLAEGELSWQEERHSLTAAAGAALAYLVLKALKSRTSVLNDRVEN